MATPPLGEAGRGPSLFTLHFSLFTLYTPPLGEAGRGPFTLHASRSTLHFSHFCSSSAICFGSIPCCASWSSDCFCSLSEHFGVSAICKGKETLEKTDSPCNNKRSVPSSSSTNRHFIPTLPSRQACSSCFVWDSIDRVSAMRHASVR